MERLTRYDRIEDCSISKRKVELKLEDIKPNPINPRETTAEKLHWLDGSLDDFGDLSGFVFRKGGMIISGHQRWDVVKDKVKSTVIAETFKKPLKDGTIERGHFEMQDGTRYGYSVRDWDDDKAAAATIRANAENVGTWRLDVLTGSWNFKQEQLIEFGVPEIVFSVNDEQKLESKEDDYDPPAEIVTDIVPGDLFEIGQHRLLCGDSTNADDVANLLKKDIPFLMVTDPPYGVDYDPEWRARAGVNKSSRKMGKVKNDDRADWRQSYSLSQCTVAYVWHDGRYAKTVQQSIEDCGFVIRNQIIWAKDRFALSRGNYHWQHEPCWYAVRDGKNAMFVGERNNSTLWEIASRDDSGHGHGTQKPVEAMARPIRNHKGDVYDPFLGSGTTMVAAHQLNRRCFGIEIDPKYCQVIIDRMLKLDSTLEIKRNGHIFK